MLRGCLPSILILQRPKLLAGSGIMVVEMKLLDQAGLPEQAILSVRAGTVRRQAPADSGRPLRFPSISVEDNPVKIDILMPVATAFLIVMPGSDKYRVHFDDASNQDSRPSMMCEVELMTVQGETDEELPTKTAVGSPTDAKDYLERHQLLPFVQALIQTVVREKPQDPYNYMARQFNWL